MVTDTRTGPLVGPVEDDGHLTLHAAIEVDGIARRFGPVRALADVTVHVAAGEIHALLGANGAGKTTLVRTLAGLVDQDTGEIRIRGMRRQELHDRSAKKLIGLVPSGDRSFYLRISGHENLTFFARLNGLRRSEARRRSLDCLASVGLSDVARAPVSTYSHGMQKRLSVARALLMEPPVLLIDEATHDLDPEAAATVRGLVKERAARGCGVIWATQRLEEIVGFADRVTLLHEGRVRFAGTLPQLMTFSDARRHVLRLHPKAEAAAADCVRRAALALSEIADVDPAADADGEHVVVSLRGDVTPTDVVLRLSSAGLVVLSWREERPGVEQAFLALTRGVE